MGADLQKLRARDERLHVCASSLSAAVLVSVSMADLGNRRRLLVKPMQVLETAAHVTVYVLDQNVMQWVRAHRKCFFRVDRAQQEIVAKRDPERLESTSGATHTWQCRKASDMTPCLSPHPQTRKLGPIAWNLVHNNNRRNGKTSRDRCSS